MSAMTDEDRYQAQVLYLIGMEISDIAEEFDAPKKTIYDQLVRAGIDIRPNAGGVPRRDLCAKGLHSMEDAYQVKGGGRACRQCKQIRDRKFKKKRNDAREARGLTRI